MYMEGILLDCINQIKSNRSAFGIYHLISGKKSIQSVHDARIFQLEKYYGVYQTLPRQRFIEIINDMIANGWLETQDSDGFFKVSTTGQHLLKEYYTSSLYPNLNGLTLSGKDTIFLDRLYLLVQTYSNVQANNYSFIPIIDQQDTTYWVKKFYQDNRQQDIATNLYQELHHLFIQLSNEEANLFVDRLSGFQHYGMSIDQLAMKYQLSYDDTNVILIGITHKLLTLIDYNVEQYAILYQLIVDQNDNKFITNTANHTYQLFKNQYTVEEIAKKRNLKINTIYDHIVEIALYDPDFDIQYFVTYEEQAQIVQAVRVNKSLKLKTIKAHCSPSINYFQIRLVLARLKELLPEEEIYV